MDDKRTIAEALIEGLRTARDRVVARRGDGAPILASEMAQLILDGDPAGVEFLALVRAAAIRMVAVEAEAQAAVTNP